MSTIVTRSGKGSPLTNTEVDANFTNLNTGKAELSGATFTGTVTANAGVVVDNITIDGNEIDVGSGDLTLDVAGNIILDADGGYVLLKDAGVQYGGFYTSSSDLVMQSYVQDKDIIFYGNDGGSGITALTLDMSAAGAASFNSTIAATSVNTGAGAAGRNTFSSGDIRVAAPNDTNIALMTVSNTLATIKSDYYGGGSLIPLVLQTGGNTNQLYLSTSGNVGIGVNPTAFSSRKSLDIGLGGKLWGLTSATETGLGNNFYFDGAYKRLTTNSASRHIQDGNGHTFDVAVSGSADSAISWNNALTIVSTGAATFSSTIAATSATFTPSSGETVVIARDSAGPYFGNSSNHGLRLITNNASRINISNSGNISTHPPAGNHFVINEDGVDSDFRVESDGNANMLFVDGGNNKVGVGVVPTNVFEVKSAGDGADQITLQHSGNTVDVVSLGQDGGHGSLVLRQNSSAVGVYLSATGGAIFNENSLDVDFRVESDNEASMFVVDGGTDQVIITNSVEDNASPNYKDSLRLHNSADGGSRILFSNAVAAELASIQGGISGVGSGTDDGTLIFRTALNATASEKMRINTGGVVFNEDSLDLDFRVESNNDSSALFVDGADGTTTVRKLNLGVGGGLMGEGAISVGTSATNITSANDMGTLVIVAGNSSGAIFSDLVFFATTMGATVVTGGTVSGGPASRTYSVVSSKLKLAMASGTYSVKATAFHGTL